MLAILDYRRLKSFMTASILTTAGRTIDQSLFGVYQRSSIYINEQQLKYIEGSSSRGRGKNQHLAVPVV